MTGRSRWAEESWWLSIDPGTTISEYPLGQPVPQWKIEPDRFREALERVRREGYFELPPVVPMLEQDFRIIRASEMASQ